MSKSPCRDLQVFDFNEEDEVGPINTTISSLAIRRLSACETMGSATTICSDRTGTLTMNQILGEAYQILSDPVQRNAYNQNGKHFVSRWVSLKAIKRFVDTVEVRQKKPSVSKDTAAGPAIKVQVRVHEFYFHSLNEVVRW